jgi:DNA-directed RNA polymerase, mitochondrial
MRFPDPVPPHLSNVGSDLCRGMLKFAEAKPLGKRGLYWLKVHLANFAGKDKMSFDDRAKYVDDNMENVRKAVKDPFSDDPWWMRLDDPFQGLATCHEIVRAIDSGNPETYMCSLPVHMDGSCNGLQHYAALGRDSVGGKAVNLLEGEGPEDVYVGVMHEVIRRVSEEAKRELPFDASKVDALNRDQRNALKHHQAAKLVDGLIDRGVVKRTVMTSVYGVTYIGARQQIQEKIEEKLEEKGYDLDEIDREVFAAAGYLATVTMEVMGDLFQGARNTKCWLADCARLISQQGHPVAWISPIGIPAIQPYRQRRSRTVVTVMQTVTMTDEGDDLPVHTSRQCTAFPPNYVHSLDSSHMLFTALEMDRRGLTYSAVHDSFWTHACDVDEMNEALRDCFIDLYSRPLLADLKEAWELRYPEVEFPELPALGSLDLNEVKSATYFFQ